MAGKSEARLVRVAWTKAQATAAAAVLRGYLAHQRERLGERADVTPSFQNVDGALRALDRSLGEVPERTA